MLLFAGSAYGQQASSAPDARMTSQPPVPLVLPAGTKAPAPSLVSNGAVIESNGEAVNGPVAIGHPIEVRADSEPHRVDAKAPRQPVVNSVTTPANAPFAAPTLTQESAAPKKQGSAQD